MAVAGPCPVMTVTAGAAARGRPPWPRVSHSRSSPREEAETNMEPVGLR